jgi:hypothetical protein
LLGAGADATLLNYEGDNAETVAKKADRDVYFMTLFKKKRPKKVASGGSMVTSEMGSFRSSQ